MFKAIKENKIIAINNIGNFPCLIYDIIEEDIEHNIEDYAQYKGEFLLKEDIPAPTEEEQKEKRARAYQQEVDPITSHIQRLRDKEQTEEIITKINELIVERDQKVLEIQEKYPYNEQEIEQKGEN